MIKRLHSNLYLASSLSKTAEFYKKIGFDVDVSEESVLIKPDDFGLEFMDEAHLQIPNESGATPKGLGIYTYVEVDDVDAHFELVKKNGIEPRAEPKTWPWGKREFVVKDPDGYKIVFYSSV